MFEHLTTCCCECTTDAGSTDDVWAPAPVETEAVVFEPTVELPTYEPAPAFVEPTEASSTFGPAVEPAPAITLDAGTVGGGHFPAPVVHTPITFDAGTIGGGHFSAPVVEAPVTLDAGTIGGGQVVLDTPITFDAGTIGGVTAASESHAALQQSLDDWNHGLHATLWDVTPASQPSASTIAELQHQAAITRLQLQQLHDGGDRLHTMSLAGSTTAASSDPTSPYYVPRSWI